MSFKRVIIDVFIDENGTVLTGKVEFPNPGEVATAPQVTQQPGAVKLDPNASDFKGRKEELKAKGYKYDGQTQSWLPPSATPQDYSEWLKDQTEVKLEKSDPDFESKRQALKEAGFSWNKSKNAWMRSNGDQSQDYSEWLKDQTEVELDKSDPEFESKKAAVKAAGFSWNNSRKIWARAS